MKRIMVVLQMIAVAAVAWTMDLPEGSGVIQITTPGTYTVSADRTIGSLIVATPAGTADNRTETVFDLTSAPTRTITFNGSDPQFDVVNHYNTVWMKGGIWAFSGQLQLAIEESSTTGQDAFRKLIVTDGAQVSGVTKAYVCYKQGGSELHVSNATFSATTMYVQSAASMTSQYSDDKNRGKLIVGPNGKVLLSGDLYAQEYTTTDNSRHTSLVRASGAGAEISAANVIIGDTSNTRACVGSQFLAENGATVTASGDLRIGINPYLKKPELFDTFQVLDSTFSGNNVYCGYGSVTNEMAIFSNSTVSVSGVVYCGNGADSCGNFVGFYDCGTIEMPSATTWLVGRGNGSCGNTILISNTVIRTSREVAAGGRETSVSNEVIVAGPSARLEITDKQRDTLNYGRNNRFRVTDGAALAIGANSFYAFRYGYDSQLIVENGGSLTNVPDANLGLAVGRGPGGVTAGNSLVVRNGGFVGLPNYLFVYGTNNAVVVDNASVTVGYDIEIGTPLTVGEVTYPSEGCQLVVGGKSPKINASRHVRFRNNAKGVLRFNVPSGGYSWEDEPARVAPIVLSGADTYQLTIPDDGALEIDASALTRADRGSTIPLVSSVGDLAISETVLAAVNERGRASKIQYQVKVSGDKKQLLLEVQTTGMILVFR